ncbi:non-canonical purine NTP pyrophosphatase [Agrobacterium sp. S2]|nr:non-canonical purine NTP pyrophosphatase [Agrobacterium sp. S2]
MTTKSVRFLSANPHKIREAELILAPVGLEVVPIGHKIDEIQTPDVEALVRDKAMKAFAAIGRPVFVEHTGLELDGLNGLPGGLTQVFWDGLEADRFAQLAAGLSTRAVTARTTICYCDGRRLHLFAGSVSGHIAEVPRGPRDFQWDCVFVPNEHVQTFAEMGDAKHAISMRRKALNALSSFLQRGA